MQDAIEIDAVELEVDGCLVEKTKTFITEFGEVYIGLFFRGCWMNVHSSTINKYIKKKSNILELHKQENRNTTYYS
jgi:hypothetical protein